MTSIPKLSWLHFKINYPHQNITEAKNFHNKVICTTTLGKNL